LATKYLGKRASGVHTDSLLLVKGLFNAVRFYVDRSLNARADGLPEIERGFHPLGIAPLSYQCDTRESL
jgi:hypothetical protein